MNEIAEIYKKYNVFNRFFDFPISGNYTQDEFPGGVVEILNMVKKDILYKYEEEPNIIIAIGSGNINNKTGCEEYTILYAPFTKVPDILILLYDEAEVQHIYSELIQMYEEHGDNKLQFVFAVSLQHDYNCIFQISN